MAIKSVKVDFTVDGKTLINVRKDQLGKLQAAAEIFAVAKRVGWQGDFETFATACKGGAVEIGKDDLPF